LLIIIQVPVQFRVHIIQTMAIGDRMFLGMQNFVFAQFCLNFPQIYPNLPKCCPNLPKKFAQIWAKNFAKRCGCTSSSYLTESVPTS